MIRLFLYAIFALLTPSLMYAVKFQEEGTCGDLGNLSLATAQQPGPLVSFGENVIDQGRTQLFLFASAYRGADSYATTVIPAILYGITDELSIFFNVPFSPRDRIGDAYSSGVEDIYLQMEYAFFTTSGSVSVDQATVVANVTFPTGSNSKNPPTGFGSSSFFIGGTFNHTGIDWFYYTSPGAVLTTSKGGTKIGDQFLYQFGIGRNIASPCGWIFAWQVELDGTYSYKNKYKGIISSSSGGNVIYVTPSIWISSERVVVQMGVGYPIVQHLFGNQPKNFFSFDFNLAFTF